MKEDENHVKLLFRFYSNLYDEEKTETMWATIVDANKGLYKLDNIPYYVPLAASDDIVLAEYDDREQMLTYRKTIEYSGNSTVQVVVMDETFDIDAIRDLFQALGCISEKVNEGYFSMEIPVSSDCKPIKQQLDDMENKGMISYAESCLADGHKP